MGGAVAVRAEEAGQASAAGRDPRHRALRIILGLLGGVLGGVLFIASMPPLALWPLVFVAPIPVVVAQYRLLPRRLSGLAPGLTAATIGLMFAVTFVSRGGSEAVIGVLVPILGGGLVALLSSFDRPLTERTGYRWFVLQMPVLWVAVDTLRGGSRALSTGGYPAYSLAMETWAIQPVSIFGIAALNLVILMVGWALALGVLALIDRRFPSLADVPVPRRVTRWALGGVAALAVAWVVTSVIVLSVVQSELGPEVRVAAVQPGPPFGEKPAVEDPSNAAELRDRLSAQTREAAARGAKLVVWPEEMLPYNPATQRGAWVRNLTRETGVYLITGYGNSTAARRPINRAMLIAPSGRSVGSYAKAHPMLNEKEAPGDVFPTFQTALGPLGMIICYDYTFLNPARSVTLSGARLIAAPSWDWPEAGSDKVWDMMVFRALENRVAMVKAEHGWDSAIVDPTGKVMASTDSTSKDGSTRLLMATVRLGPRNSPVLELGNWVGWLCVAGLGALIVAQAVRVVRRRRGAALGAPPA